MKVPSYFILYKEDNDFRAKTTNIKPDVIHFQATVILRGWNAPITVISTLELQPPHSYLLSDNRTSLRKSDLPVYKSNLQKCLRRRLDLRAIKTAYAILSLSEFELLRRLPI